MSRISLSGYIKVPAADLAAVQAELPVHIELTRAEPGCLRFEVMPDPDDSSIFHVAELFSDRSSFAAHQRRVRLSKWGEVAAGASRHYEITEVPDEPRCD